MEETHTAIVLKQSRTEGERAAINPEATHLITFTQDDGTSHTLFVAPEIAEKFNDSDQVTFTVRGEWVRNVTQVSPGQQ
jgi:hypothetical protein